VGLHVIGYSILLGIFGGFYPNLIFLRELELLDKFLIRFFGSYCYNGAIISLSLRILCSSLLLGFMLSILCFKYPHQVKRFIFQWMGLYGMIFYLFWIFVAKQRDSTPGPTISAMGNYLNHTLVFFSISFGICLLFLVLNIIRSKDKSSIIEVETIPSTIFECPHCHTQYLSRIMYCSVCNEPISDETDTDPNL